MSALSGRSDPTGNDPLGRFSNRAEFYARSRPKYPPTLLDFFRTGMGLNAEDRVADVGSGTGFLSELFVNNGNMVFGVEPNAAMRAQAEAMMKGKSNFRSVDGSAEASGLADKSVEYVVAGQAFHWFEPVKSRAEFKRILTYGGWVAMVWNLRRSDAGGFGGEYDRIQTDFTVDHRVKEHSSVSREPEKLAEFFLPVAVREASFPSSQALDLEGVLGRAMSQSNLPAPGSPTCENMLGRLRKAFAHHARDGRVWLYYDTKAYYGQIA